MIRTDQSFVRFNNHANGRGIDQRIEYIEKRKQRMTAVVSIKRPVDFIISAMRTFTARQPTKP